MMVSARIALVSVSAHRTEWKPLFLQMFVPATVFAQLSEPDLLTEWKEALVQALGLVLFEILEWCGL